MDIRIGNKIFTNVESVEMALELGASQDDISRAKGVTLVSDVQFIAERVREIATGNASRLKVNGWISKTPSALRVADGGTDETDIAIIAQEATIKGTTPLEQAQKIKNRAAQLAVLNGAVDGFEDKLIDMIQAGQAALVEGLVNSAKESLKGQTIDTIGEWIAQSGEALKAVIDAE